MPADGSSPYRQKSLERLSSPERLDQLLRLVDRKSWLPLATLGALVLVLVAWAVFGTVPERVHGRGILTRPRDVVEIHAPGSGVLKRLEIGPDMTVLRGQELGLIDRPELASRIDLQKSKLRQLTALADAAEILARPGGKAEAGSGFEDHIRSARALAAETRDKELQLLEEERLRLQKQRGVAKELAEQLEEQAEDRESLHAQELVSQDEVIEAKRQYMSSLDRLSEIDGDLRELQTRTLQIEQRYMDSVQRIADLKLELQDYEQQIAEVSREIEQLETEREQATRIVAEQAGRILEIHAAVGAYLSPGDPIATMSLSADESPLESLVYFNVRDGKRLDKGMKVQVTPDTVERERFGGIVGEIDWISSFPVTLAEVEMMVGNRQVAEQLTAGGYWIQVLAELQPDPSTPTRLAWTSSQGPVAVLSPGTTTTARVTVDERAPITFVLPFLRATSGID